MYCKQCGYENEDDALFCENCGAELSSFYSDDVLGDSGRRKKVLLIAVVVTILIISILAIFTLENYIQSSTGPDPRAINLICPYCGAGPNTLVAVSENATHIKWYCQYCGYTFWEPK